MDAINQDILKQLQEYAQKYFAAIIEVNSTDGECNLKPGKYSAKDLIDNFKSPCGIYIHPASEEYEGKITAAAGTFKCSFPYRRIFAILADWETMSHAGKQKAIFEIGEVEEKSAKVLINEKNVLGAYKTKTMKLQRIGGNWWGQPKEIQKEGSTTGYYELNGVMFAPGKTFWGKVRDESNKRFTEKFDDAEITKMLISYLAKYPDNVNTPYFAEVVRLAGISIETEESKAIANTAKEEQRKREEERQHEEAEERERKRIREEEYRKSVEEEERQAAESLAKAKEKFISGKMISREDFERVAGSVGYEINIRTLGTLRKRITWIETKDGEDVTVYGTNTRRGLDGTFAVIREVYAKLKELADMESAKMENEPQEEIKAVEMPQILNCEPHTIEDFKTIPNISKLAKAGIIISGEAWHTEYLDQSRNVLARIDNLGWHEDNKGFGGFQGSGVFGKTAIFDRWEYAVIAMIDALTDYLQKTAIQPLQSPEISETSNYTKEPDKRATEPRNEPKQAIRIFRTTEPRTCKKFLIVANVPRCSTAYHFVDVRKMVYVPQGCSPPDRHPPIRGDCEAFRLTKQTTRINKPQRLNLRL